MLLGKDQLVIVLEWTTEEQLDTIKKLLDKEAQKIYDDPNYDEQIEKALGPELIIGLANLCCDLEIPGYEMS